MSDMILKLIGWLAEVYVGTDTFARIKATVERWKDKQISGVEKHDGVTDELKIIGINASASVLNLLIELAVQLTKLEDRK